MRKMEGWGIPLREGDGGKESTVDCCCQDTWRGPGSPTHMQKVGQWPGGHLYASNCGRFWHGDRLWGPWKCVCYHILVTWDTLHIRREFRYKSELPGAALWASSVHLMKGAGAWLVVSKLRENKTLQLTLGEWMKLRMVDTSRMNEPTNGQNWWMNNPNEGSTVVE